MPLTVVMVGGALLTFLTYRVVAGIWSDRAAAAESRRRGCKPCPRQPHRWPLGIDQLQRSLAADREKLFPDLLVRRFEEMGAFTFSDTTLGSPRNIFTIEPKNVQAVLATQFRDFELGPIRRGNFDALLGQGIFTQDGKAWEHSRALIRPQFAREQVSDLVLEERHVQNLMRALPADAVDGWTDPVDLQVLFFRLTLDSATEFLFGESVDSQLAELPARSSTSSSSAASPTEQGFASAFDTAQGWLATRVRFNDLYWLVDNRGFRRACRQTHDFADQVVRRALHEDRQREKAAAAAAGERQRYVFLDALAAETRDPRELRHQLLNILLAGRDTTASLLGWLFFLLARHPAVLQTLRQAIVEAFGGADEADADRITFTGLKACAYLQYCLHETLRLYPVVPVNARHAVRDTTIPCGGGPDGRSPVFVRQGETVVYTVHVMHRRKDLWGPDADEFRPERWHGLKQTWNWLPFNGGPRICIGQQFALTEASYVTVRLLQRFDRIENLDPDPVVRHNLTLTNCSGNGVKVRLHAAAAGLSGAGRSDEGCV
ncbi:MAG: hypothetical protein M1826_000858 [Phylliscum demangeonii]|nr:MAG: hypothetical protein M1826_000858 [Phylliscum demangeonii]